LTGTIQVDVHYYEDGNVRLVTKKPVSETLRSGSSTEIAKVIGTVEKKYQEELNRAFNTLSEGAFKSLRRQLPVMRQKVNWDQITGYRVRKAFIFKKITIRHRLTFFTAWSGHWWW